MHHPDRGHHDRRSLGIGCGHAAGRRSTDFIVMARAALEAAIRDQDALAALVEEPRPRAKAAKAAAEIRATA
jgi:hypothetical protein